MPPSANSTNSLRRIRVRGYKSIRDSEIEIRPLTILAGANSSGKSSIMQPLLLIKQTRESTFRTEQRLVLDGPILKLGDASTLKSDPEDKLSFDLEMIIDENETRLYYVESEDMNVELEEVVTNKMLKRATSLKQGGIVGINDISGSFLIIDGSRLSNYGSVNIKDSYAEINFSELKDPERVAGIGILVGYEVGLFARRLLYLPGLRDQPQRSYPQTARRPPYAGPFPPYTASVLARWQDEKETDKLHALVDAIKRLGLTRSVEAVSKGPQGVELRVGRLPVNGRGKDELVNVADVGLGVSQVLPILVALIEAEPGGTVYIEQPELHLHPKAQRALAGVFADAATRGVRVIVETHSSLFLLGVQTLVAEGALRPDLVALHWFSRTQTGFTKVTRAELDESGAFGPDWPEDFSDTELDAQAAFLDAAMSRKLSSAT